MSHCEKTSKLVCSFCHKTWVLCTECGKEEGEEGWVLCKKVHETSSSSLKPKPTNPLVRRIIDHNNSSKFETNKRKAEAVEDEDEEEAKSEPKRASTADYASWVAKPGAASRATYKPLDLVHNVPPQLIPIAMRSQYVGVAPPTSISKFPQNLTQKQLKALRTVRTLIAQNVTIMDPRLYHALRDFHEK